MDILKNSIDYIFSFEAYVLLPIILFIISLIFRISLKKAFELSLIIGIGFLGIFMILDYFVANIGPAIEALAQHSGLQYNVLDIGWISFAAITWSFYLTPLLIILVIVINLLMFVTGKTRTINVDIFNYWHFIFLARIVYEATENALLSIIASLLLSIIALKLADWSAGQVKEFTGLSGISITTICTIVYYPFALLVDQIINKIDFLKKIDADPEYLRKRLGLFGEPMLIGFIIGILLGIGAGYDLKATLGLAFSIAGVVYLLPVLAGVLSKGLMEVSEGVKAYVTEKFSGKEIYIGLDVAVLLSNSAIVVTGVLLMPIALLLAFLIPGVNFIPLGDLSNLIGSAALAVIILRGNIFRAILTFIPIIAGKLLVASRLSSFLTNLTLKENIVFEGYSGAITSFLDGGNLVRFWFLELFSGKWWPYLFLPLVVYLFYLARKKANNVG